MNLPLGFTLPDAVALGFFIMSWLAYHLWIEPAQKRGQGLAYMMNLQRQQWMQRMSHREVRIVDTAIMNGLQNGTAFFASTSLLAIGGAATLLRATDDVLKLFSDLPFGFVATRGLWEVKIIGLGIIFGYAFFKFAWAYRLFNYAAILIGATPPFDCGDDKALNLAARRAAQMNIVAGQHFTRGQRAFFFSFAYMGWFVSPYVLVMTTAGIVYVTYARQFSSDARAAVMLEDEGKDLTGGA